jgi:hypothetical protein
LSELWEKARLIFVMMAEKKRLWVKE